MRPGSTPMVPPVWNAGRGEGSFAFAFTSMVKRDRACTHGILGRNKQRSCGTASFGVECRRLVVQECGLWLGLGFDVQNCDVDGNGETGCWYLCYMLVGNIHCGCTEVSTR